MSTAWYVGESDDYNDRIRTTFAAIRCTRGEYRTALGALPDSVWLLGIAPLSPVALRHVGRHDNRDRGKYDGGDDYVHVCPEVGVQGSRRNVPAMFRYAP